MFYGFVFLAQQELRSKREQELASLKKSLEEETVNHEASIAEMRHKHVQELNGINEQLENLRKAKAVLEKAKSTLEAENADLATELRSVNSSRQENDRRRKQAESQIAELQVNFKTLLGKEHASDVDQIPPNKPKFKNHRISFNVEHRLSKNSRPTNRSVDRPVTD